MLITKKTKFKDVCPLLNENNFEKFLSLIPEHPLEKDIISMTIGEFSEIVLNENKYIQNLLKPNEKVLVCCGKLRSFRRQMKNITDYLQKMSIPQSLEEKMAGKDVEAPDFISRMLIDVTKFFNLHSFAEAEQIKVCDYLLILQDQVATAKYNRNYQKIIEQKSKTKKK